MPSGSTAVVHHELQALFRAGTVVGLGDPELLDRFLHHRGGLAEAAFAALIERHGGAVQRVCRAMLADAHEAEDAAQAVFLVLARRAGSIRRSDALSPWLFGVAIRVARRMKAEAIRRRAREKRGAELAAQRRDMGTTNDADGWPELFEELDRLPEKYRRPLILRHLEGLSHEELAGRLRCPVRTVQTRLTRGRARLRDRLIRRGLAPTLGLLGADLARGASRAADLPAAWAETTARAAIRFSHDRTAAGIASAVAVHHARGVMRAMIASKLKLTLLAAVVACMVSIGLLPMASAQKADAPPTAEKPRGEAGSFTVWVVAEGTGKPIPGATIRALIDFQTQRFNADADGRATIDLSKRRLRDFVGMDVWADGFVQQRFRFSETDPKLPRASGTYEIRLFPAEETLGGTVRDEDGKPIAGATVAVWGYLGARNDSKTRALKDPRELAYNVEVQTDSQGRWRSKNYRGMLWAYLYLSHPDFVSDNERTPRSFGAPNQPVAATVLDPLRDFSDVQVMRRGVVLGGRVIDDAGRPVAGASVAWLEASNRQTLGHDLPWMAADAEGRFTFPHARPGALLVVAKAPGHAPEIVAAKTEGGPSSVDVRLGPAKTIAGRVVDGKGRPIEGAHVGVDTWRGFRGLGIALATDRDGRFRWAEAPGDPILLNASKDGHVGIFQTPVSPGEDRTFTLKRSLVLDGSIRDAATGKRIEESQIEFAIGEAADPVAWRTSLSAFSFQGTLQASLDAEEPVTYRLRVKSKGFEPLVTRPIKSDEGKATLDLKLARLKDDCPALAGVVLAPDGRPLVGAEVALGGPWPEWLALSGGRFPVSAGAPYWALTGPDGRFSISASRRPKGPRYDVIVIHDRYYAEAKGESFEASRTVVAKPWGRVEGTFQVGDRRVADHPIRYSFSRLDSVNGEGMTTTDAQGRFAFDRVAPGEIRISTGHGGEPDPHGSSYGVLLDVEPGETSRVTIGGTGRAVVARVVPPEGFDPKADYAANSVFEVKSDRPDIPYPKDVIKARDGSIIEWGKRFQASPEGKEYRRRLVRISWKKLGPDGLIRIDDLPADNYELKLTYSADPIFGPGGSPDRIAYATRQFTIPEIPGGRSDRPLDLGVIRPALKGGLKVGEIAPAFEAKTVDGKVLRLADYRGKVVLLDFWATWCGPCLAEVPELKAIRDRFRGDDRFVMISLSLDAEADAPRQFAAAKGLDWVQGSLGDWSETNVPALYHVEAIPSLFLIGPDGKILAKDLRGDRIKDAVAQALERR